MGTKERSSSLHFEINMWIISHFLNPDKAYMTDFTCNLIRNETSIVV